MSFRRRLMMACVRNRGVPITVTSMFTKRTTGNGITILNDKALLKGVRGNSCVWKQDAYFGGQVTYNNTTFFTNIVKGSGTSAAGIYYNAHYTGGGGGQINLRNTLTAGHVYVLTITLKFPNNLDLATTRFIIDQATSDGATPTAIQTYNVINGEVNITRRIRVDPSGTRLGMRFVHTSTYPNNWIPAGQSGIDFQFRNVNAFDLTAMFGDGNEPTTADFLKMFPLGQYDRTTGNVINNAMASYVSKDPEETALQNVSLNVPTLTGKLNGEGESVAIFPDGMKSTVDAPNYAEMTYIQKANDTHCRFILDYIPSGDDIKFELKFSRQAWIAGSENFAIAFGTTVGGAGSVTYGAYQLSKGQSYADRLYGRIGTRTYGGLSDTIAANTDITVVLTYNESIFNGVTKTAGTTKSTSNSGHIELFPEIRAKLYYFKVYKGEDLVVDIVPVRIGGEACVYDRVADKIYHVYNDEDENGVMTCGPDVAETVYGDSAIYDEIKQDGNIWKAYKRVSSDRIDATLHTGRREYAPLAQEEVYVLDDQTIPTEITVADQGVEEILPTNGATPTTAPAIMEIEYRAAPALTSFSLGNPLSGGLQNVIPSDNNVTNDVEEIQEIDDTTDI